MTPNPDFGTDDKSGLEHLEISTLGQIKRLNISCRIVCTSLQISGEIS